MPDTKTEDPKPGQGARGKDGKDALGRPADFSTDPDVDKDGVVRLSKDIQAEQKAAGFVPDIQPKAAAAPLDVPRDLEGGAVQATGNAAVLHANALVGSEVGKQLAEKQEAFETPTNPEAQVTPEASAKATPDVPVHVGQAEKGDDKGQAQTGAKK